MNGTTHPTIKPNATSRRILATKLCVAAWEKTLQALDVPKSFLKLGYLWPNDDGSHIVLRALPNSRYCPTNALINFAPQAVEEPRIEPPAKHLKQSSSLDFSHPESLPAPALAPPLARGANIQLIGCQT